MSYENLSRMDFLSDGGDVDYLTIFVQREHVKIRDSIVHFLTFKSVFSSRKVCPYHRFFVILQR